MQRAGIKAFIRSSFGILVLLISIQLLFFSGHALGQSGEEFLSLAEVEKGMEGTGKTVVEGKDISTFSVEVVDVIDEPGQLQDFIVVRASGEPVEQSGGVAQGMSGSPVYIDGKLIGALSRSAQWSKDSSNPIGLVTPIGTMLELLEDPGPEDVRTDESDTRTSSVEDSLEEIFPGKDVEFADSPGAENSSGGGEDQLLFKKSVTPVMVSGLSEASLKALKDGIGDSNLDKVFDPLATLGSSSVDNLKDGLSGNGLDFHKLQGSESGSEETMELQPGGPMGVSLAKGDLSIGALGTVTYRDEDQVLGLGHRFLLSGATDFLLTEAAVLDTVKSYKASFKLGDVSNEVGAVTQDRTQGVMGVVGEETNLFETDLRVSPRGVEGRKNFNAELVKSSDLIGSLSYATIREAIDRSLNRQGPGTIKVDYEVTGEDLPEPLERTDIFFSSTEASFLPSLQVALFIDALAHNPFADPDLSNLEADVSFERDIRSGQITYFATDKRNYAQGDLLAYQVKIQNYRGELVEKTGGFQLPQDLPPGNYVVAVYGGPRPANVAPPENLENFEDWISYLNSLKSYESLSVEVLKPFEESVVPMAGAGYRYESAARVSEKMDERVIYGSQALSINVSKSEESSSEEEVEIEETDSGEEDGEKSE